jgi:hypothetical protein
MQLRGQVLQEKGHAALNGFGADDVVVIQHQGDITFTAFHEIIGQHGQHRLWWRGLRGAQQREGGRANLDIKGLQGGNQVGEKARRVVVLCFQREPGE